MTNFEIFITTLETYTLHEYSKFTCPKAIDWFNKLHTLYCLWAQEQIISSFFQLPLHSISQSIQVLRFLCLKKMYVFLLRNVLILYFSISLIASLSPTSGL